MCLGFPQFLHSFFNVNFYALKSKKVCRFERIHTSLPVQTHTCGQMFLSGQQTQWTFSCSFSFPPADQCSSFSIHCSVHVCGAFDAFGASDNRSISQKSASAVLWYSCISKRIHALFPKVRECFFVEFEGSDRYDDYRRKMKTWIIKLNTLKKTQQ